MPCVLPPQDEDDEDDDEGQEDGPDISSPNDVEDCHIITNKSCAELPLVTLPMTRSDFSVLCALKSKDEMSPSRKNSRLVWCVDIGYLPHS